MHSSKKSASVVMLLAALSLGSIPAHAVITAGSKNIGAVWFVGDSITQGNADGDSTGGVRADVYAKLAGATYTFTLTGHSTANTEGLPATGSGISGNLYQYHSGVSGAVIGTNTSTRTGITQNIPTWWASSSSRLSVVKPNVILILIGSNDANSDIDITHASQRLTTLINTIYAQPGVGNPTILVGLIPPNHVSSTGTANVALYNAAVPGVVRSFKNAGKDVYLVDQFTLLNNNFTTAMNSDGLHPNATGNGYMSQNWFNAIASCANQARPPIPYGLTGKIVNAQASLSWEVVPGAYNGYNVKRSTTSGGPYTTIANNVSGASYIDAGNNGSTTYYYVVSAVNAAGEGANSAQIAVGSSTLDTAGIYQLQNVASQLVLNQQGSLTNGSKITQWSSASTSDNLRWKFIPTSNGYYQINSVKSGKDAVVQGASTSAGAGIIQWSFGTSGDDQWKPVLNSDGTYTFSNLKSGLLLEDPGSSTSTSTQMDQWTANGGNNQKWKLIRVN
ncbi:MAG TPA: RICIN domain-containing protein [Desulfuromonadaceae bacterium]|nr:RICIN domain-containing protein [Desulfuromonadaceae bacterium]